MEPSSIAEFIAAKSVTSSSHDQTVICGLRSENFFHFSSTKIDICDGKFVRNYRFTLRRLCYHDLGFENDDQFSKVT